MTSQRMILPLAVGLMLSSCAVFQGRTDRKMNGTTTINAGHKADTTKKTTVKPQPYREIITDKAVTDKGLFNIHKIANKYYFEIPDSILNRNIVIVSRISKAARGNRPGNGFMGYAGDRINQGVIQFSKGPDNKMFIKRMGYGERSKDSSENGMYWSVLKSNVQPIIAALDIRAYSPDSSATVIEMTDYLNSDNDIFYFDPAIKKLYNLTSQQNDKSYVQQVASFPINIEITAVKTYFLDTYGAAYTYELNTSMMLLDKKPMKPRAYDKRVGYFPIAYVDFDDIKGGIDPRTLIINRWRLEPKEEDIEKYMRGELVEPKKPIVYYIDPTTPKKWVSYLIQGVNDWQKAFEKAGFKNAIYALEAPKNDPEWSLFDARHNAIIYKPSVVTNAMGPHIHDPVTGEILETHVEWFHNITKLLQQWYFIQASPNDPSARKMDFDDSLMGELIRFVAAHEVGHTLGLMHNMGASATVPVEKLRDKKWVEENGHTPSIMDYARFNYVAQPEDSISQKGLFPRIGVYDEWAIEWGYRWFPDFKTEEEERAYMIKWVTDRTSKDNKLWYGSEFMTGDPRIQTESIGDNAMKAGKYGIKNLQRVMENLSDWTKRPNEFKDESLGEMQQAVIGQYRRYLLHVISNIGGIEWTYKTTDENGPQLAFTSKERQKEAVQFLQDYLFTPPTWLLNKNVFYNAGGLGVYQPLMFQQEILQKIMSHSTFTNLLWFETYQPDAAYTFTEFLNDLETGIFSGLQKKEAFDIYRRNLQKVYVEQLIRLLQFNSNLDGPSVTNTRTDALSMVKGRMKQLLINIDKVLPAYKDGVVRLHLMDIKERLIKVMKEDKKDIFNASGVPATPAFNNLLPPGINGFLEKYQWECDCWKDR